MVKNSVKESKIGKNFIKIYNDSFSNLSAEELYIYAWLFRHRHQYGETQWSTMTSIDHIISVLQFNNVKPVNPRATTKQKIVQLKIRDIIIKLKTLKYINCDITSTTEANMIFTVTFEERIKQEPKGFSPLHYYVFDKFQCITEFMIYNYINRFGGKGSGRKISDSDWEDILGVSRSKLRTIITKMNSDDYSSSDEEYNNRIWKFSGTYIKNDKENEDGKIKARQEENEYYTNPSDEIMDKWYKWYVYEKSVNGVGKKGVGLKKKKKDKNGNGDWGENDPM